MVSPNLVLLYVEDPHKSQQFYRKLLNREPASAFPTFVAFYLDGGWTLGLWASSRIEPTPPKNGNRSEIAFMVPDEQAVRALHREWVASGVTIEREPYTDVFGLTFVALDPDGHRIRACTPDKD